MVSTATHRGYGRRPARATVKQLMTHTTGLGYWFWSADLQRWEAATGTPTVLSGSNVIFTAPMLADPGTRFEYGINIDWLGKVVEAASGVTLDVAVKEGITGPLGMDETAFAPTAVQRADLAPVHVQGEDGAWVATEIDLNPTPDYWAGGHGLHSHARATTSASSKPCSTTAPSRARRSSRRRRSTRAFTNQIGELDFPPAIPTADPASTHEFNLGPGYKFGYGLLLNTEDIPGHRRAWSGAWAGLCNTHFWVDRTAGITGAIYSQFLPFVPPAALQLYADFEAAIYASR